MHDDALRAHLDALGYRTSAAFQFDGKIHRIGWVGEGRRPSQKTGWYVGYDHGEWTAVAWGDWRDNQRGTWTSKPERRLGAAERDELQRRVAEARAKAAEERMMARLTAAARALIIWTACHLADSTAPPAYCTTKQIPVDGLRVHPKRGYTVVPIYDERQCLVNLQTIHADGQKVFLVDAAVAGAHWRTGPMPSPDFAGDLIVAEGVATAATVRRLAGGTTTTFAAFNAGNLESVAMWVRSLCPNARILIAADDDRWERDGTPRPNEKNTGRVKAVAAASAARALAIFPKFANPYSRGTDWNDLFIEENESTAQSKWRNAVQIASLDRQLVVLDDREYMLRRTSLLGAYRAAGAGSMGVRQIDHRRREIREEAQDGADADSPAAVLVNLANEAEFWHDQFGAAYCTFEVDGAMVNARVEGQLFRDWLRLQFEDESGGQVPSREAVESVILQFAARARARCPKHPSHIRCGYDPDRRWHWLDLGRPDWSAVRITPDGWDIVQRPTIKFIRSDDDCALPVPVRNGDGLAPLWGLINVAEQDRCLIAGWLLSALLSTAPAFGLNLFGPHGSAKSSATRILRRIIDPSSALTQNLTEKRLDEFTLTCIHQWLPALENVSYLSNDMQDALCRLSTGETDRRRRLYTDSGMVNTYVRRPWIINGIINVCSRGDLAERSVPVQLHALDPSERKTEASIEAEFLAAWPGLLATVLDAAVEASRNLDTTAAFCAQQGYTHRMADATLWITAGEDALGFSAGSFLERLRTLQADEGALALDAHPVVIALQLLLNETTSGRWIGTNEELLKAIQEKTSGRREKGLPDDVRALGRWIGREQARLKESFGITISDNARIREDDGRRIYQRTIYRNK